MTEKKPQDDGKKELPEPQAPSLAEMSVIELKALAYDESVRLQQAQQNIQTLNQELSKR